MKWAALLVLVFVTSCGTPPVKSTLEPVPPIPRPRAPKPAPTGIQPGETLDVLVMEDDSFNGSYKVRSTGHIIVPQLGRLDVRGKSAGGAEQMLAQILEENQLTKATVIIDRADLGSNAGKPAESPPPGTQVFLSGKVSRPGRYTMVAVGDSPPTVHQAILQAGGCSRFAYKRKTHVLRRFADGRLRRIDADLIAIESGMAVDVPLLSGDIVVVPEKKVDFGL